MEKLVHFINRIKVSTTVVDPADTPVKFVPSRRLPSVRITDTSLGLTPQEVEELARKSYPEFTAEEENEVRECLGITPFAGDTKSLIVSTVARISHSRNNSCVVELPSESEEEADFSTFRMSNVEHECDDDDEDEGKSSKNSKRGLSSLTSVVNASNFETEEWERRILAIERGEWLEGMEDNGWRRWKKDRPKLREGTFTRQDALAAAPPSSQNGDHKDVPPIPPQRAITEETIPIALKVPFAELRTEDGEEFYTSFVVLVQYGNASWGLCKRYSEFKTLLDELYAAHPAHCRHEKFPPKRVMGNFDDKFIEERRLQLECWISAVLQTATSGVRKSACLLDFLAATPADFAMRKAASDMNITFDLTLSLDPRVHKPNLPAALIIKKLDNKSKVKVGEFNMPIGSKKNWEILDTHHLNEVFFVEIYEWDAEMKRTTKYLGGSDFTLNVFATATFQSVRIHLASPLDRGWWGYFSSGYITVEKRIKS